MKHIRFSFITLFCLSSFTSCYANPPAQLHYQESPSYWYQQGQASVQRAIKTVQKAATVSQHQAKNIILFVGDGMGISTITAARIHAGQLQGKQGEEHQLFFETLPYSALSKTYNTNQQTPDSAGTMTAMMTGIKSKAGFISVGQNLSRADCSSLSGNRLTTALEHAEQIGLSTGIVSTARITHATPAATYAHVPERNYEDDQYQKFMHSADQCDDIASQLIDLKNRYGNGLEVVFGGGRRHFLPNHPKADPETGLPGNRHDGRDLTQEWLQQYTNSSYIWNKQQFDALSTESIQHILGLFNPSHMQYEIDRSKDKAGEPSLSAMTRKAIDILNNNPKGFFLMVESGRIDHAHHAGNAHRALTDTIEFDQAVKTAYQMTNPAETLIIVTADHSHVFTIAGYPTRGNPILGKVISNDVAGKAKQKPELAQDNMPYTTLGYMNGLGYGNVDTVRKTKPVQHSHAGHRTDLSHINTESNHFHQEALVPLASETHGGEDVAIFASGPGSSLFQGTIEQNVIFHIMNKAAALSKRSGLPAIK